MNKLLAISNLRCNNVEENDLTEYFYFRPFYCLLCSVRHRHHCGYLHQVPGFHHQDHSTSNYMREYAVNQDRWIHDFVAVFDKMMAIG